MNAQEARKLTDGTVNLTHVMEYVARLHDQIKAAATRGESSIQAFPNNAHTLTLNQSEMKKVLGVLCLQGYKITSFPDTITW